MIFALVGNQNCGKTTLFDQLTGSNQHVGNFPGVTVDSKEGVMRGAKGCSVVDLPGIYSLRPYTAEEIVTRDFILNQKPDGIINIVDATNIERNLYLTLQLLEMQIPMVLALNMMDEVRGNGGTIDVQKMSDELGIPVVPIAAAKNDDNLSIELIEEAGEKVGKAVAFLINTFNPETVIVGGNLAAAGDYIMLPLKSATNKYSLNLVYKDTKFRVSKMTENANAWGVAMLIRNKIIGL